MMKNIFKIDVYDLFIAIFFKLYRFSVKRMKHNLPGRNGKSTKPCLVNSFPQSDANRLQTIQYSVYDNYGYRCRKI